MAEAGFNCTLHARTSILAAANPIESQWNKSKTIIENIQLPPTFLSYFDLFFLLPDPQESAYDSRLTQPSVSWDQYGKGIENADEALVKSILFQKKIIYFLYRIGIYFGIIYLMHVHLLVHN